MKLMFSYPLVPPDKPFPQVSQNNFKNSPTSSLDTPTAAFVCIILDSEPSLGKSKELNSQGIKVQVNRAFKTFLFFVTKKTKKSLQVLQETFFNLQYKYLVVSERGSEKLEMNFPVPLFLFVSSVFVKKYTRKKCFV